MRRRFPLIVFCLSKSLCFVFCFVLLLLVAPSSSQLLLLLLLLLLFCIVGRCCCCCRRCCCWCCCDTLCCGSWPHHCRGLVFIVPRRVGCFCLAFILFVIPLCRKSCPAPCVRNMLFACLHAFSRIFSLFLIMLRLLQHPVLDFVSCFLVALLFAAVAAAACRVCCLFA